MTRNTLTKALAVLRDKPEAWLAWDELDESVLVFIPPPWGGSVKDIHLVARRWNHVDALSLAAHLQDLGIWAASPGVAEKAAEQFAKERLRFHPVKRYLDTLAWDGTPRIQTWLSRLLGAEDSADAREMGARWLVAAVARVMQPGCKAACLLALESPHGRSLSRALQILGGLWHRELVFGLGTQAASEDIRGAWIVEAAEVDDMTAGQTSRLRRFIGRTSDRRGRADWPRQCAFAITGRSLGSESDAIRCGKADLDALRTERDQLWAEAALMHQSGETAAHDR